MATTDQPIHNDQVRAKSDERNALDWLVRQYGWELRLMALRNADQADGQSPLDRSAHSPAA